MCNTSYCSCKSACPSCHINNDVIYFINEVIRDWLTPAQAKENKEKFKEYYKIVDAYSMMEYLNWVMDEEHFQLAIENYRSWKTKSKKQFKQDDTIKISWKPNPNPMCEIVWDKVWGRCRWCWSIARYIKWKQCPMYRETQGSTVNENKISDEEKQSG